jgi:hypothetical protein
MSIHNLASSPRATLLRNPPSKIPGLEKPEVPPKRNISRSKLPEAHGTNPMLGDRNDSSGDYVTISATAELTDVKNEAFIASSISLTDSEYEPLNSRKCNPNTTVSTVFSDESTLLPPPNLGLMDISDTNVDFSGQLQLTPMIREIDVLTRTAEQLTLSTLKGKSASSLKSVISYTLPESPTELNTTPLNVEQVENKFIRTLKENKITNIRSDREASCPQRVAVNLQRRLSVQDRGVSPSQRRIMSSARRRSHEISRVTPVVNSARFSSMRSPKVQDQVAPVNMSFGTLRRSPTTRCTLRRGRPNTTRVGLARPSPVRTTTPRSCNRSKDKVDSAKKYVEESLPTTPMRRMSSVQELVKKLERDKSEKNVRERANTLPLVPGDGMNPSKPLPDFVPDSNQENKVCEDGVETRSKSKAKLPEGSPMDISSTKDSNQEEIRWVAAHKFGFERKDLKGLRNHSERDSIHFLKTLHAGKVPATVEFFNKIAKPTLKSPGRSMIPRYTALHRSESSRSNLSSLVSTPEGQIGKSSAFSQNTTPTDKISRRLSSIDIRQKHEQLLENIKKERSIKRSATTAAAYQANLKNGNFANKRTTYRSGSNLRASVAKRPISLAIPNTSSPAPPPPSRRTSFRRNPGPQTPKITEEDESLTTCVQNAIDTLLGKSPAHQTNKQSSSISASPLKSSNIANIQRHPSIKEAHVSKKVIIDSLDERLDEKLGPMIRTRSERGTKASTGTTPKVTPKIKKALTTRAFDNRGTPTLRSAAHKCPTITPMRRYPQRCAPDNRSLTPLKATHTPHH